MLADAEAVRVAAAGARSRARSRAPARLTTAFVAAAGDARRHGLRAGSRRRSSAGWRSPASSASSSSAAPALAGAQPPRGRRLRRRAPLRRAAARASGSRRRRRAARRERLCARGRRVLERAPGGRAAALRGSDRGLPPGAPRHAPRALRARPACDLHQPACEHAVVPRRSRGGEPTARSRARAGERGRAPGERGDGVCVRRAVGDRRSAIATAVRRFTRALEDWCATHDSRILRIATEGVCRLRGHARRPPRSWPRPHPPRRRRVRRRQPGAGQPCHDGPHPHRGLRRCARRKRRARGLRRARELTAVGGEDRSPACAVRRDARGGTLGNAASAIVPAHDR